MLTNPYDNRRKRYREGIDDESDALVMVQRGLADIDKKQTDAAALREAQRKTARNEGREDAATKRQAALDKQAAEDRQTTITRNSENDTAVRSERAAREAELKRKTDAENKKAAGEKAVDEASARGAPREAFSGVTLDENGKEVPKKPGAGSVDPNRGARMREGGLRAADVAGLAAGADMSPEALQAAVDDIENKRRMTAADREAKAKAAKDASARDWASTNETVRHNKETEKNGAAAVAAGLQKTENKDGKLTAGETESIVELQTGLSMLDKVKKMKTGEDGGAPIDTGPISAFIQWGRSKVGLGDPDMVKFKATVGSQLADYIKSISGASVSEGERAALLENVPTTVDNDEAFMAKLESVRATLDNKLKTKKTVFDAMGKDTRGIDAMAPSSAAASDTVTITNGKETLTGTKADADEIMATATDGPWRVVK